MLQINPFLDCTLYSRITVHIGQNTQDTKTLPNYITVTSTGTKPVANFVANQTTITVGGSVIFTDQSTNSPTSWSWNFGDGTLSTTQSPSHTYTVAGTYTVTLTATNSFGSDTKTSSNYITVNLLGESGIIFNPDLTYGSVSDIEGNNYKTIQIGTQTWMAENLKTTKYNDGTAIPNVIASTWAALTTGSYCDYSNTLSNSTTYGRLYNWFAVDNNAPTKVASNGGKNVCPTSWHVPTDVEWTTLTTFLGGESVAGGKLKETGTTHWRTPDTGATNETGFTALPGGSLFVNGAFDGLGIYGGWWSSTEGSNTYAWSRYVMTTIVYRSLNFDKASGFRVRCVRDF